MIDSCKFGNSIGFGARDYGECKLARETTRNEGERVLERFVNYIDRGELFVRNTATISVSIGEEAKWTTLLQKQLGNRGLVDQGFQLKMGPL